MIRLVRRNVEGNLEPRFCEIAADGIDLVVREGRLGEVGRETREACASAEDAQARADALGSERTEAGWKRAHEPITAAARYLAEGLVAELRGRGLEPKAAPTDHASTFAAYHGLSLPPELHGYLAMRDQFEFVYHSVGELRIFGEDVWLPDPAQGNLVEQVVAMGQRNYLSTDLLEYFCGCVYLGSLGNGDAYFAALMPGGDRAEVYYWDHETNDLEWSLADSLATMVYANHLLAQVKDHEDEDGADGDEESANTVSSIAARFATIRNRCKLPWHFSSLTELGQEDDDDDDNDDDDNDDDAADDDAADDDAADDDAADDDAGVAEDAAWSGAVEARYYFYRSLWIQQLLRNRRMGDVPGMFKIVDQSKFDADKSMNGPWFKAFPATALYTLWRLFFFDKADQLAQAIAIAQTSDNPIIRDAAALIAELQGGRKELGAIEDIHALRREFLALDLDPDRAEDRAREQAAAAAAVEAQAAADRARAEALVATHDIAGLIDLAWAEVGNEVVIPILYAAIGAAPPSPEAWARAQFVLEPVEDQPDLERHRAELAEVLGTPANAWLAPLLLTRDVMLAAVGAMRDRRALPFIAERLRRRGAGMTWRLAAASAAAAATGDAEVVPWLCELVDDLDYDPDDYVAAIGKQEPRMAALAALGELGDPRAEACLVAIARGANAKLRARALSCLGAVGGDDARACLLEHLDTAYRRPALYGLARMGAHAALPRARAIVDRLRGARERCIYEQVMAAALVPTAERGDPEREVARFALGVVEANKHEDTELREIAIGLLASSTAPADRAALTQLLGAESPRVRRAARQALAPVGVEPRYLDQVTAVAGFAAGGAAWLIAGLADATGVFRHNLVDLAVETGAVEDAAVVAAAVAYGRTLCAPERYSYTFVLDKWERALETIKTIATLAQPTTDAFAAEVLTHPSPMIRDALRYGAGELVERLRGRPGGLVPRHPADAPTADAVALTATRLGESRFGFGAKINGACFGPTGDRLYVVGGDGGAPAAFDRDGVRRKTYPAVRGWAYDVDVHPAGKIAALGLHAGHLLLLDLASGDVLADLRGHRGVPTGVRKVRFSPSGKRLVSCSDDQTLIVWDVEARAIVHRVTEAFDVNAVDWLPDESAVVFGTDKQLGVVELGATPRVRRRDRTGTADVRVSPAGDQIAVAGVGGLAIVDLALDEQRRFPLANVARARWDDHGHLFAASWDGGLHRVHLDDGHVVALPGHDAPIFGLALDPQTGAPFAGGDLGIVVAWDGDAPRPRTGTGHVAEVTTLIVSDGELVSGASDGTIVVWDAATGAGRASLTAAEVARGDAIAVSPDRARLLVTGGAGAALIDRATGATVWRQQELARSEIACAAGDAYVVASRGELVWLAAATGAVLDRRTVDEDTWLEYLVPLADDHALVAGYRKPDLQLWNLRTRTLVRTISLPPHPAKAETYAVAANATQLVASRWDRSFDLIDLATGAPTAAAMVILPHAPIALSPDGRWVVAGEDQVYLFDTATFAIQATLAVDSPITALAFLDDAQVAVGHKSGAITVVALGPVAA